MRLTKTIDELEQIHIHGRTIHSDGALWLFWPGSGLDFRFKGSFLSFQFESDYESLEPWISILIDGEWRYRMPAKKGLNEFPLFINEDPEVLHHIEILKDTQPMPSDSKHKLIIHFLSFEGEILEPEGYQMNIEFIGDSITSGEGTVGGKEDMDWIPKNFSFIPTYARVIAQNLKADYSVISQSGWGIYSSWNNNIHETVPSLYDDVCRISEKGRTLHYFSKWQPDVIVINLGTNDEGSFHNPSYTDPETGIEYIHRMKHNGKYPSEDIYEIMEAQADFLMNVRRHNPYAMIIWCYGMIGHDFSDILREGVKRYQDDNQDDNVFYCELPEMTEETAGSRMHPGPQCHKDAADALIRFIMGDHKQSLEEVRSMKEKVDMYEKPYQEKRQKIYKNVSQLNALFLKMNLFSYSILFFAMFFVSLIMFASGIISSAPGSNIIGWIITVMSMLGFYFLMILFAVRDVRKSGLEWKSLCEFRKLKLTTIPLLIILGVITRFCSDYILQLTVLFFPVSQGVRIIPITNAWITVLVAPVAEEILMRGFFFHQYKHVLPVRKAVILSAFLFGLMHFNYIQFFFAIFAGIVLALTIEATGSIYASILIHMIVNLCARLQFSYRLERSALIQRFYEFLKQFCSSERLFTAAQIGIKAIIFIVFIIVGYYILKMTAKEENCEERFAAVFKKDTEEKEKTRMIDGWLILTIIIAILPMTVLTKFLFFR